MKKTVISLLILPFLFSCGDTNPSRKFTMQVCNGSGLLYSETWIECDSLQMITTNEAFIWVDGTKMKIIGERGIKPSSN